jgi:hypothetical protein
MLFNDIGVAAAGGAEDMVRAVASNGKADQSPDVGQGCRWGMRPTRFESARDPALPRLAGVCGGDHLDLPIGHGTGPLCTGCGAGTAVGSL